MGRLDPKDVAEVAGIRAVRYRNKLLPLVALGPLLSLNGGPRHPRPTLAYVLHGMFLLTSIGIAIRKKTGYYPVITAVAATTNVAANFVEVYLAKGASSSQRRRSTNSRRK